MTTPGLPDWLGALAGSDAELLEEAPGGSLSEHGRQVAVEASLSLLGVYFSGGNQPLVDRPAIGRSAENRNLDALHAGLRLRVALAAGHRLVELLDAIVKRPTFRYELRRAEQVGALSSALDINRWATRPEGTQDGTYPVVDVQRGLGTPENVLVTFAVQWLMAELQVSLAASLATPEVVEFGAAKRLRINLNRRLQLPALHGCATAARTIRTPDAASHLVSQVKRRLRRREVANSGPYQALTTWIDDCIGGAPVVSSGDVDLSVYGNRFDNKLFELWCLGALGRQLASALHLPEPAIDPGWRRSAPAYALHVFSGRIEIYFQRAVGTVDKAHAARWQKENGQRLGGIPDIVVRAQPTGRRPRFAVIDPKLRQRDRLPAEELYKVLGYLQNFAVTPPIGVVLIYTTETEAVEPNVFRDNSGGVLISAQLNPAAPDAASAALRIVVETLLRLIDYEVPGSIYASSDEADDISDDERAESVVESIRASVLAWGRGHLGELASSRARIVSLITDARWSGLHEDVQVMMATADLVGHNLDSKADFSGPVIGICASIEHVLHAYIIEPGVGNAPAWQKQVRTFGGILDAIEVAYRSSGGQLHRSLRAHLDSAGIDVTDILGLLPFWRRMNTTYRVPAAAHREILTQAQWQQLYGLLMGTDHLFVRTFDLLHTSSATKG